MDLALLVLRLSALGLPVAHGWAKLVRMAGGDHGLVAAVGRLGFPYPTFFAWAAVFAETVLPILIALGLFTRAAAAVCAFNMAVAAFLRHQAHRQGLMLIGLRAYPEETVKGWGNPELALLYLVVFVALALAGGGRFALERALRRSRR